MSSTTSVLGCFDGNLVCEKREREFTVVCEDREWGLGLLRDERVGVCLRLRLQSCDVLMPTM